jgi:hypothetical protein
VKDGRSLVVAKKAEHKTTYVRQLPNGLGEIKTIAADDHFRGPCTTYSSRLTGGVMLGIFNETIPGGNSLREL